jgi:predicted esterase
MATTWADSANQADHPCFVVAPQCPENNQWLDWDWSLGVYCVEDVPASDEILTVRDLLDSLIREFSIDTYRIYITGLSMGGYGTFDMIARWPDLFAAAVPMSGAGDTSSAAYINHIPMWIVHGEADGTVPVSGSRQMVRALEKTGMTFVYTDCNFGDCSCMPDSLVDCAIDRGAGMLYSEIKGGGHVVWEPVYTSSQLVRWVFKQNKQVPAGITEPVQSGSTIGILDFQLYQNYPNPFNPVTMISFNIAKTSNIRLEIYNAAGQRVAKPVDEEKSAGRYTVAFDGRDRASGVYFYRVTAGDFRTTRKMILLR